MNIVIRTLVAAVILITCTGNSYAAETATDSLLQAKKHFSFAVQYKKTGAFEEAEEQYRRSIAFVDTIYQVRFSYADLLMKMERPDGARREYRAAFELNPSHENSARMLTRLYYEAAEYDSALVMYQKLYKIAPDRKLLDGIAALSKHLGHTETALDTYDTIISNYTPDTETYLEAARLSAKLDRPGETLAYTAGGLALTPDNVELHALAADAATKKGDTDEAIDHIAILVEADPENATWRTELETIARRTGDSSLLKKALEARYTAEPHNPDAIGDLAEFLFSAGEIDRAKELAEEGLAIDPSSGTFNMLLGEYYRQAGDTERALACFRKAAGDSRWAENARQRIWELDPPESDEERAEQEFFNRGRDRTQQ